MTLIEKLKAIESFKDFFLIMENGFKARIGTLKQQGESFKNQSQEWHKGYGEGLNDGAKSLDDLLRELKELV